MGLRFQIVKWLSFHDLKDSYCYPECLKTEIFHLPSERILRIEKE